MMISVHADGLESVMSLTYSALVAFPRSRRMSALSAQGFFSRFWRLQINFINQLMNRD